MLWNIIKWSASLALAYSLVFIARPIYWEAWKVHRIVERVAVQSAGKTKSDLKEAIMAGLKADGVQAKLSAGDFDLIRNGDRYDIAIEYTVVRLLYGTTSLEFAFKASSDTRSLW